MKLKLSAKDIAFYFWHGVALVGCVLLFASVQGCTTSANLDLSKLPVSISTPTATVVAPAGGPRAAKIIFVRATSGSFDTPPTNGTPAVPGSGLQAVRVFNADGTLLANEGPTGPNWPLWLKSFELGISGSSNSSSKNPNCARFAQASEATDTSCDFGAGPGSAACGAPLGRFRISEADCSGTTNAASVGVGGPSDGVYIRAVFDRATTVLGDTENILAVLEYSASALNSAPADPTSCYVGGAFSAEACSDFVWQTYIKHSETEVVQPFLMLIPPMFASILATNLPNPVGTALGSGTGFATKQIVLPLAADPGITVLQMSRTKSNFPDPQKLIDHCTPGSNNPGNSPLCAGVVLHSLTLYRI